MSPRGGYIFMVNANCPGHWLPPPDTISQIVNASRVNAPPL